MAKIIVMTLLMTKSDKRCPTYDSFTIYIYWSLVILDEWFILLLPLVLLGECSEEIWWTDPIGISD